MNLFNSHICTKCGHVADAKKSMKGSFVMELIIWAIFIAIAASTTYLVIIVPFVYSCTRAYSKKYVCSLCNSPDIIPADSPNGKAMIEAKAAAETIA